MGTGGRGRLGARGRGGADGGDFGAWGFDAGRLWCGACGCGGVGVEREKNGLQRKKRYDSLLKDKPKKRFIWGVETPYHRSRMTATLNIMSAPAMDGCRRIRPRQISRVVFCDTVF